MESCSLSTATKRGVLPSSPLSSTSTPASRACWASSKVSKAFNDITQEMRTTGSDCLYCCCPQPDHNQMNLNFFSLSIFHLHLSDPSLNGVWNKMVSKKRNEGSSLLFSFKMGWIGCDDEREETISFPQSFHLCRISLILLSMGSGMR